jgi:hypothetical protein
VWGPQKAVDNHFPRFYAGSWAVEMALKLAE